MPAQVRVLGMRDRLTFPVDVVVNVCSNGHGWERDLSPFILGPCPLYAGHVSATMENGWQYTKVYRQHLDEEGHPSPAYWEWAQEGWDNPRAVRYPMGRGARPEYSLWDGEKLDYISARKRIYGPVYRDAVQQTGGFAQLVGLYNNHDVIALRDFDGYDHVARAQSLTQVLNNPVKKMGHAFVLAMLLTQDAALQQLG